MKLRYTLLAFSSLMLLKTAPIEAYQSNIEAGKVPVAEMVAYFDGRTSIDRTEEGRHFVEYVFDGHALRMYEEEAFFWFDGEPYPYDTFERNGVLMPVADRHITISQSLSLPADFFEREFGYKVDGEVLVYGEPYIEEEKLTEEDLPQLPEEEGEAPQQQQESDRLGNEEDGGKADKLDKQPEKDDEKVDEKEEDDSKNKSPETEVEPDDEEESGNFAPVGSDEEEETEENPKELGHQRIELDLADAGRYNKAEKGYSFVLNQQSFLIHFLSNHQLNIRWAQGEQNKTMDLKKGANQTFRFKKENGDYYTLKIQIADSRKEGLTYARLNNHMMAINPKILTQKENGEIHISYKEANDFQREEVLREVEESLIMLGVRRFQVDKEEHMFFHIWLNLDDSDWNA